MSFQHFRLQPVAGQQQPPPSSGGGGAQVVQQHPEAGPSSVYPGSASSSLTQALVHVSPHQQHAQVNGAPNGLPYPPPPSNTAGITPTSPTEGDSSLSASAKKAPYGSGDVDDGYTLRFDNLEEFHKWRLKEEEEKMIEFVKGDTHRSKAVPPRFKEHTKLVCARHSRSGRKKYVKKFPDRVRKVPSRKLEGQGCPASISFKTYHNSDEVRVCYVAEHSHPIGPANFLFTKRGRRAHAAEKQAKNKARRLAAATAAAAAGGGVDMMPPDDDDDDDDDDDGPSGPPSPSDDAMNQTSPSMGPETPQAQSRPPPPPPPQPQAGPSSYQQITEMHYAQTPAPQPTPAPASAPPLQQAQPAPAQILPLGHLPASHLTPAHIALNRERWSRMSTLFESIRDTATTRGFEYPAASVAALEGVLFRMLLEGPPAGGAIGPVVPLQQQPQSYMNGVQVSGMPGSVSAVNGVNGTNVNGTGPTTSH